MRYATAVILFALSMVCASVAQDIPPGSYQQTCRDIKMHGSSLRAKCETSSRQWIKTRLDNSDRCVGDITNVEGQLTCNQNATTPQGTYLQSCKNVKVRWNTLYARCKDINGQWVDTQLTDFNRCAGGIGNINGQLQCGAGGNTGWYRDRDGDRDHDRNQGNGPQGSFAQTCRDISVRGDDLRARCETVDGQWRDTSLDGYNSCIGDIVNDNGQLECTRRGGRTVPNGTYAQTCRQIYVRGDFLRAQCETRDGRWVWTQLNDWDSCRSGIVNLDGQLHCDR
ncbi:MAG TPA: CVNH domain-containing protein [Candidatus Angelobacter sp.]